MLFSRTCVPLGTVVLLARSKTAKRGSHFPLAIVVLRATTNGWCVPFITALLTTATNGFHNP